MDGYIRKPEMMAVSPKVQREVPLQLISRVVVIGYELSQVKSEISTSNADTTTNVDSVSNTEWRIMMLDLVLRENTRKAECREDKRRQTKTKNGILIKSRFRNT
jgi:hypothetical protein